MSFLETPRFPDNISHGSQGGPAYNTSLIVVKSGHESRNINWESARHQYDVGYGIRKLDALEEMMEFFHVVAGRGYGFRYKDWADYKSVNTNTAISDTDQALGSGDASETDFQLIKKYEKGAMSRERDITKPVSGTTVVSLDDVSQPTGWTVDTTTGIVTFSSPPGAGVVVKAGFEFDVPVRFDTDYLAVNIADYRAGAARVPIIEIRDIA